ncbi:putative membrane protein containing bPH2 domain [Methanonatronarchaeum thermophilum]|uniref:Putative membrane protein containing bPH2 domain n=1 Tax=Methanonatronarchaeum thermophilum TaxID=1927129 RepID=A0A1Y3GDR3_9EURY|nr:PH domain-containing protein [Methanonatronarchaeum thermophilum]OUJ19400.1 putative membrane protein containing bPH2 domain [Methanonatronarchaeum thermophilum]
MVEIKLHRYSVIYRSLENLWGIAVFLFLILIIEGLPVFEEIPVFLTILVAAFLVLVGWNYAYWKRFDFKLDEGMLEIKSGVFSRRKREVPLKRVQNVDVRENIIQQALGIAELRFETAGGGATEAVLKYVSTEDAELLRKRYQYFKEGREATTEAGEKDKLLYEIDPLEMGILCLTSYSLASTIAIFAFITFIVFTFEFILDLGRGVIGDSIVLAIALLILVSFLSGWLLNAGKQFITYFDFKLYRSGDTLKYKRGLLKRYSGTIPLDKLQNITVRENVLQRIIGYAALDIDTAGYSAQQRAESGAEVAIPITKIDNIPTIIKKIEGVELERLEKIAERAMQRYGIRYSILAILITIPIYLFAEIPQTTLIITIIVLFTLALTAAYLKWIHKGYKPLENYLITRNGFWKRQTKIVPYYRIQNVIVQSSFLQRRWKLASVIPDTAGTYINIGGEIIATDLDKNDARELGDTLFRKLQKALKEYRKQKTQEKTNESLSSGQEKIDEV